MDLRPQDPKKSPKSTKMSNDIQLENCSSEVPAVDSDFFAELFDNRASKVAAVVFSALCWLVIVPTVYAVIDFERASSDHKKTLLNKLMSAINWLCLEWFFIVQVRLA
jgi:hypothetical protein